MESEAPYNIKIERTHKDTLFQLAFNNDPEAALSLYNAVNESQYTDSSKLELTLLDGGFFMRMQNDSGFILDHSLNLYEHQSTINENMPLRGLFYFAELYKQIIPEKKRLYQKKLIKIPTPKFIVFYNGTEDMGGDQKILKLSDAFEKNDDTHGFEWSATMLNINCGHNEKLMKACKCLNDYSIFVDKVRTLSCNMPLHNAIIQSINECIEAGLFVSVLKKYGREIDKMEMLREFDEKEYAEFIKEEAREEERAKTELERQRADIAETNFSTAIKLLIIGLKSSNHTKEDIIQNINDNFPNLNEKAEALVNKYY